MNNVADPVIMAIKPMFAKMIYEGRKVWEFRKTPPPLMRLVYVYESAPVSAITGTLLFRSKVEGILDDVWETVTRSNVFTKNGTGIGYDALRAYVGNSQTVAALRVCAPEKMDKPVKILFRPPLNWCSLTAAARRGFRAGNVVGRTKMSYETNETEEKE